MSLIIPWFLNKIWTSREFAIWLLQEEPGIDKIVISDEFIHEVDIELILFVISDQTNFHND